MSEILIVEDEVVLARSIVNYLERRGYSAGYAVDAASAKTLVERAPPRLVILDFKLNEDNGLRLLEWLRNGFPGTQVVMMTGHGDIDIAVRAMKAGARDFLVKPTALSAVASIAHDLMLDEMQGGLDRTGVDRIIGRSSAANMLRATLRKLAKPTDLGRPGVLIMGPKGAGKTQAAIALHETAAAGAPLEILDCALQGANALGDMFRRATGGTLVLKNVSELSSGSQTDLLRLVLHSDASPALVATTSRHLVPGAAFSADLLYHLQIGWIDIPPLSDRAADVLPIADYFARRFARDRGEARPRFTSGARARLLEHSWPGNIAELSNCIERAIHLQTDGQIDADHIRAIGQQDASDMPTLMELELRAISQALSRTGGNVSRAADLLGISRDTLRYRMEKFDVPRSRESR